MCDAEHLERIPCVFVRVFGSIASGALVCYSRADEFQLHGESNANHIVDVSKHKNYRMEETTQIECGLNCATMAKKMCLI